MANPVNDPNALEMSDEDFMKQPLLFDSDTSDDVDDTDHDETEEGEEDEQEKDPVPAPPVKEEPVVEEPAAVSVPEQETATQEEPPEKEKPPAGTLSEAEYAQVGRQILAEFKANGTTMQVKNVEDALQLMQMGANYHKKMTGLKPSLKTLKLLENNGLLDPEKLNYLIDLSQKKPEAIKQLLKDSKLDPMTLDMEEETEYVPAKRTVSDKEMALDEVLSTISDSPMYTKTLTVLSDEWDDASRKAIADDPQIIGVINAHMEKGIYDQVATAVAYERSLGKLVGVSELEAYQRVGSYMHENNLFKGATGAKPQPNDQRPNPALSSQDTPSAQEENDRKNRKKAVSPSRQGPVVSKKDENYNPLAMSDEEFAKLNNLRL